MRGSKAFFGLLNQLTNINTRSAVFLACLVLSFVFWLLTTLYKTYLEDISIPVAYQGLPEHKVLVSKLPENLVLEVEATGFEILWMKWNGVGDEVTIDASLNSLKQLPSADAGNYVLVTEKKLSQIRADLEEELSLVAIRPDSILFKFRDKVEKTLPIKFKGNIAFDGQFGAVEKLIFEPAFVKVTGPAEALDTMKAIFTDSLVFESVDESIEQEVDLLSDKSDVPVSVEPKMVKLSLAVEEFTEGTVDVPVMQKGSFSGGSIKLFPTTVRVKYLVPLSQFEKIRADQFKAEVDLNSISEERTTALEVSITESPSIVKRVKPDPTFVEFIIQR